MKIIIWITALIITTVAFCNAGEVTLQWDANTEPSLVGYKMYYTDSTNSWCELTGKVTEYTVVNLTPGDTYTFQLTAYDNASESLKSNSVVYTDPGFIPTENPKEPIKAYIINPVEIRIIQ